MAGRSLCLLLVISVLIVMMHASTAQTISCGEVLSKLENCGSFLLKGVAQPAPGCCTGVQQLNNLANTKQARQLICSCFEKEAKSFNPKPSAVAALPGVCGVPFPYSLNPNQDCSKIS